MRPLKVYIKNALKNIAFLLRYDISLEIMNSTELNKYLTTDYLAKIENKIIEDCIYEFDEDKLLLKNLTILDEYATLDKVSKEPKSFCRFGDGEINIMQGYDTGFQKYDPKLAERLRDILRTKSEDMYIGLNRYYFHTPMNCSERNRQFYRIYGTEYRHFFLEHCEPSNQYIDAAFLCAYYRTGAGYDYEAHYSKVLSLFAEKKIAIVCGEGILDSLQYDVFQQCSKRMYLYAPARNAFAEYDDIYNEVLSKVPKDFIVCIILGMTAKVLVTDLTKMGYVAWDIGHLAKDYDAFMRKTEKTEENMDRFWAPD